MDKIVRLLLVYLVAGGICQSALGKEVYTLGVVPQFDVRRTHSVWTPILKVLEHEVNVRFELHTSPSIPAFERELTTGNLDFAYMNPYHMVLANRQQGYLPLVRDLGRALQGIVVVQRDSPITSVAELADQTMAFPAANALGATLLTRAEIFEQHNITVTPFFVRTHSSVYLNVALGEAVAGGGVQKTFDQQSQELQQALRILHHTKKVAPHPLAVHPRVASELWEKVQQVLLDLGTAPVGKKLLAKVPITEIGVATIDDYQHLNELNLERFINAY